VVSDVVCIVIMVSTNDKDWSNTTSPACHSNRGSNWWSAPNANTELALPYSTCGWFKTRIPATYVGCHTKTWKVSNEVRGCHFY
jgi:hypothetical protein